MQSLGKHLNWISSVNRSAAAIAMAIVAALALGGAQTAQAQTFSLIHTFTGGMDGAAPEAGLTLDAGGNLYGTASAGGTAGAGAVYKLTRKGTGFTLNPLYSFAGGNDGIAPIARVVFGPNGTLYGTTSDQGEGGGAVGTVFNLGPPATVCKAVLCPWNEKVLHRFSGSGGDGFIPGYGDLLFDKSGNIYGTTNADGAHNKGNVFKLSPSANGWIYTDLYDFTGGSDGRNPISSVVIDAQGKLYGTASRGGSGPCTNMYYGNGCGVVWEITP